MKVTPIVASTFLTDGGAMFGLVPKPVWTRLMAPDEDNRVPQHTNALLVELDDGRLGLIEPGCGPASRFDETEVKRSGLGPGWPLMEALDKRGVEADAIDFIVCTHAHWDHLGGVLGGEVDQPTAAFPNARIYLHEKEWTDATSGNPLLGKAYPRELIDPVQALYGDRIQPVKGDRTGVLPGIALHRTGGHTAGHCLVELKASSIELDHPDAVFFFPPTRILYLGDAAPTRHHLRLLYGTGYDQYPMDTRRWKQQQLPALAQDKTPVLFPHDTEQFGATLSPHPKKEFVPDKILHIAMAETEPLTPDA